MVEIRIPGGPVRFVDAPPIPTVIRAVPATGDPLQASEPVPCPRCGTLIDPDRAATPTADALKCGKCGEVIQASAVTTGPRMIRT